MNHQQMTHSMNKYPHSLLQIFKLLKLWSISNSTVLNQSTEISHDQLCQSVGSLNNMQCKAYDRVLSWTRNKMKNLNSLNSQNVEPIYLFITGGGGAGKSHLIKPIYHTVAKMYKYTPMDPEKPTVLLTAPME